MKRHPNLSIRTPERVSKGRAAVSRVGIKNWFDNLKSNLNKLNAVDVIEDSSRVFNLDETNIQLCPSTGKVIGLKGWRNIYEITPGPEKSTLTFVGNFSASGLIVTPAVIYPYKRIPSDIEQNIPDEFQALKTESGWMTSECFFDYIINIFNVWLNLKEITKPIILFVDGHKTHLTLQISTFCEENGIILYLLPPNTTHILQPADVGPFRSLKAFWRQEVRQFQRENVNEVVRRQHVAPMLHNVLQKVSPDSIKNGFKATGLCPLDPEAIDFSKLLDVSFEDELLEDRSPQIDLNEYKTALKVINSVTKNNINAAFSVENLKVIITKKIDENQAVEREENESIDDLFSDDDQHIDTIETEQLMNQGNISSEVILNCTNLEIFYDKDENKTVAQHLLRDEDNNFASTSMPSSNSSYSLYELFKGPDDLTEDKTPPYEPPNDLTEDKTPPYEPETSFSETTFIESSKIANYQSPPSSTVTNNEVSLKHTTATCAKGFLAISPLIDNQSIILTTANNQSPSLPTTANNQSPLLPTNVNNQSPLVPTNVNNQSSQDTLDICSILSTNQNLSGHTASNIIFIENTKDLSTEACKNDESTLSIPYDPNQEKDLSHLPSDEPLVTFSPNLSPSESNPVNIEKAHDLYLLNVEINETSSDSISAKVNLNDNIQSSNINKDINLSSTSTTGHISSQSCSIKNIGHISFVPSQNSIDFQKVF